MNMPIPDPISVVAIKNCLSENRPMPRIVPDGQEARMLIDFTFSQRATSVGLPIVDPLQSPLPAAWGTTMNMGITDYILAFVIVFFPIYFGQRRCNRSKKPPKS